MRKTVRSISLVLVIIFAVTAFCGCGRKKGDPPVWTSDKRVVMTMGGYNVTYDFYRYLFLNTKDYYDNGDDSYWTKEGNTVEKIKDYVIGSLENTYGMFALADKYEITLSKDDKEYIKSFIESSKEGMTDEEYKASLAESYMTEELYTFMLEVQQLEYLVYEYIVNDANAILKFNDDDLIKAIDEEFIRATHILFTFKDEAEREKKLQTANSVLEKLNNGEDFEKLKEEYSDDTDLKGNKDGYYFTHGEFKNEFEYTAFELEEGAVSEIVLSEVGYHIIKRLPLEEAYINENFDELRNSYKTSLYYKMVKETADVFSVEYKDTYKNIELNSFE